MALLLLDEAQSLTVEEFSFLKDVFNDLRRENIQLVTILMGQSPDLHRTVRVIAPNLVNSQ